MVQVSTCTATVNDNDAETKLIERIRSIFDDNQHINDYVERLEVSVDKTLIILHGDLPTADLKQQLVPAIRQAGILWQVCNLVHVQSDSPEN